MRRRWLIGLPIFVILAALSACEGKATVVMYQPPTPAGLLSATRTPLGYLPTLPPPACEDSLRYLEDVTIPDGMIVIAGVSLDKQWRVENDGTCNWDSRYRLRLTFGDALGAAPDQALYPARAGSTFILHILYTAPSDPGNYRSEWQAYSPNGQPFGDPVFIEINVAWP